MNKQATEKTGRSDLQAFVWNRRFLLHAKYYLVDRRKNPYRRLSMTLIVGNEQPFEIGINGQTVQTFDAVLLASNVSRDYIAAGPGGLSIFDLGINQPSYWHLCQLVKAGEALTLDNQQTSKIRSYIANCQGPLECSSARQLFDHAVQVLHQSAAETDPLDKRIQKALTLIDEMPREEISSATLAELTHLSESRLRALFKQHLDCTLSQYIRWVTAWRAVLLAQQGASFTEIAHAAGFYDLAHADRVFNEVFGMNPTIITDPKVMQIQFCEH